MGIHLVPITPPLRVNALDGKPVLRRLQEHRLFVKLEKSEFHVTTISFLGAVLTPVGVKLDGSKNSSIIHEYEATGSPLRPGLIVSTGQLSCVGRSVLCDTALAARVESSYT
ncbi:hypothetical protein DPEC_G00018490 [Dallia pectoralis]|uniref:Uncharacterized protein n=1 Tax=Dallia pectoralis TaxID=75939 RepID=A0ACC2HFF2_DALPE|nr:hypothetical protein DPEC_G00018490 [Dallia pectoralis]